VGFTDARTVVARTLLTLEATTGNIFAEGKLTLKAGTGIVILDDMTSISSGGGAVVINADYDSHGDGTLTISTNKNVNTNNSDLTITAWDTSFLLDTNIVSYNIHTGNFVKTGSGYISIHGSKVAQTIGLGATSGQMHITDIDLQSIETGAGLRLGDSGDGTITIDDITQVGSNGVTNLLSMIAKADAAQLVFVTAPSTFNALIGQADSNLDSGGSYNGRRSSHT